MAEPSAKSPPRPRERICRYSISLRIWLIRCDSNVSVVIGSFLLGQLAARRAERVTTKQPTICREKHPVENVLALEGKSLSNLVPLFQFRWNLKERAREHVL